jgi:hypothetical protein
VLERIFSGSPMDASRYSVPGLIVMALGVALAAMARKIAKGSDKTYYLCKFGGLLIVMAGAVITVKLFG